MDVKEVIYEYRMFFYRKRKFLWWSWWSKFFEGGRMTENSTGKLLDIRYKEY